MTLRTCARLACWRSFPVELPSARIYCDDECEHAARAEARARTLANREARALDAVYALPCVRPDAHVCLRAHDVKKPSNV
jgi:hypothetical protein